MGSIARNELEIAPNVFLTAQSIVCDHIVKGFPKLVCNLLDLQFLPVDLVLQWQIHSNEYGPRVHLPGGDLLAGLCDDDRVEDEVHQPQPVARLFWLRHLGLARGRRQASGSATSP